MSSSSEPSRESSPPAAGAPASGSRFWGSLEPSRWWARGFRLRRRGFWAGWGGWIITATIGAVVVALLVGWVLLWISRPEGPSIALLTLGCLAFTLVLALLATLQNRLQAQWRQRHLEALLLAGVSHDLRTPISAVRAAAQALGTTPLDPDQRRKLIGAIVRETRRLALRVDNLLETGRLDVERGAFHAELVDLTGLLRTVLSEAEHVVVDLGGNLQAEIDEGLRVEGDHRMLRLLIDNLVDNAILHTEGAPEISVNASLEQHAVVIRIRDRGVGFAEEAAPELFTRFHHGHSRRSGAGLGLALARAIARGHRGSVRLESPGPGQGAVAEVRLPASMEG